MVQFQTIECPPKLLPDNTKLVHSNITRSIEVPPKLLPENTKTTFPHVTRSLTIISKKSTTGVKSKLVSEDDVFTETPMESLDQRRTRNKAATHQLTEWFLGEWATWQRHGLLCGIAKRCTPSQSNYLLSALEPVFHRDYLLQAGVYPWQCIGTGRTPLKLQKLDNDRYKKSVLLDLARRKLKSQSSENKQLLKPHLPTVAEVDTHQQLHTQSAFSSRTKLSNSESEEIDFTKLSSEQGKKKWLKLKTVQLMDPKTLLGDKDTGLAIREILIDGLGVWTGSHLRRNVPIGLKGKGIKPIKHSHFLLKSAMMTHTAASRKVEFRREFTKSSMSFRTENMYTPGGGTEKGLPKTKEEMKEIKKSYKKQLKTIYKWMQSLTELEMSEAMSSILLSISGPDLRFLTSCLVQRENEGYDINQLTDSLLLQVFQYLDPQDLKNASLVCQRWYYLGNLDLLWQNHCLQLGKQCGIDTVEELTSAFQLDELSTNQHSVNTVESGLIDWKRAYEELFVAINEAKSLVESEEIKGRASSILSPKTHPHVVKSPKMPEDSAQICVDIIQGDPEIYDDELEIKQVETLYSHLIGEPQHENDSGGFGVEQHSRASPSLSDFYDIESLMNRRNKWRINIAPAISKPYSPCNTESIFDELAFEMGNLDGLNDYGETSSDNSSTSLGSQKDGKVSPEAGESKYSRLTSAANLAEKDKKDLVSRMLREESLFSFERDELVNYQKKKAKEAFEQLKLRRQQERAANLIEGKRNKKDGKEARKDSKANSEITALNRSRPPTETPKSLIRGVASRKSGATSAFTARGRGTVGSFNVPSVILEETSEQLDDDDKNDGARISKLSKIDEKGDLAEEVEVAVLEALESDLEELIHGSHYSEKFQSRLGHRSQSTIDESLIGQIALDIRPPIMAPREIVDTKSKVPYDVQWRYPFKVNPFKGAVYQNRILGVKKLKILQGHMDGILCMKISSGRIMTGSVDQSVRVWGTGSGRSIHKLYGHKGSISSIDFNEDWIVSGSWDMTIIVWSSTNYKHHKTLHGHMGTVSALVLQTNKLFSASHDSSIRIWDVEKDFQCVKMYESKTQITSMAILPVQKKINRKIIPLEESIRSEEPKECIYTSVDGVIRILDLEHDRVDELVGHTCEVTCLKMSGNLLISGSSDGQVRFWNKNSLECESGIQAHSAPVLTLEFHRRKFYTASQDTTIREWDLYTMTCMRILHGHKGPVRGLKVTDRRITSCSDDGEVRMWELYDPLEVT